MPIASSARRAQQLIMGVEMFIFAFPPFVDLVFGANGMAGLIWLASWKAFYAFWFFSMALVLTCLAVVEVAVKNLGNPANFV